MKIYLLEPENNKLFFNYLKNKYKVTNNFCDAQVLIVYKIYNVKEALDMVDEALISGKEILCIKSIFAKEHYVSNYLIKNGATYI